jgi:hypothetical protein
MFYPAALPSITILSRLIDVSLRHTIGHTITNTNKREHKITHTQFQTTFINPQLETHN